MIPMTNHIDRLFIFICVLFISLKVYCIYKMGIALAVAVTLITTLTPILIIGMALSLFIV